MSPVGQFDLLSTIVRPQGDTGRLSENGPQVVMLHAAAGQSYKSVRGMLRREGDIWWQDVRLQEGSILGTEPEKVNWQSCDDFLGDDAFQ